MLNSGSLMQVKIARFIQSQKSAVLGVAILAASTCLLIFFPFYQSRLRTEQHGAEMAQAMHRVIMTRASIPGVTDPQVMATIATGEYLDYLIKVRCQSCDTVQVATEADIVSLKVVEYSADRSEVLARVEFGWRWVLRETGELADSRCYAQAYTVLYIFEKHEEVWKVAGGKPVDRHPIDNSPELLTKYCGS